MDLSHGFDEFIKHDDSIDERLDSLLKTIMHHEQQTGKKIDSQVVTWRGIITKVRALTPISEMVTRYSQTLIITDGIISYRSWRVLLRIVMGIPRPIIIVTRCLACFIR